MRDDSRFNRIWYEGDAVPLWMRMLSALFAAVAAIRRALYRSGILQSRHPGVPVVVVGNIVAGGAGKTPLTIALVAQLQQHGLRVGVVSRGYGAKRSANPVFAADDASVAGDEATMITLRTGAPVCVHPARLRAARALLAQHALDALVCDDGLQHYSLARDIEIAVVDGARGAGNGRLLPAGPLREPVTRLHAVDHVVINGELSANAASTLPPGVVERAGEMKLRPVALVNVRTAERRDVDALLNEQCVAVAGIGNPQRFFAVLGALGYVAECRAFPDHHVFSETDFEFAHGRTVLMTEKDAVKCRRFAAPGWWYLEVDADLPIGLVPVVLTRLEQLSVGK